MTHFNPINALLQLLDLEDSTQAEDALYELFDALIGRAEFKIIDTAADELAALEQALHNNISKTAWDSYLEFSLKLAERHGHLMQGMYAHGFRSRLRAHGKTYDPAVVCTAVYEALTAQSDVTYSDDLQQLHAAFQEHVDAGGREAETAYWEAMRQFYYQAEIAAFQMGNDAGARLIAFIN